MDVGVARVLLVVFRVLPSLTRNVMKCVKVWIN